MAALAKAHPATIVRAPVTCFASGNCATLTRSVIVDEIDGEEESDLLLRATLTYSVGFDCTPVTCSMSGGCAR